MVKKIPVYQARVTDGYDDGIFAMSFVDYPAVEKNFVALRHRQATKLTLNRQKQILTGVVLVPDQLIYRNQEPLGEYYMRFSARDIERIAQKMMRTGIALTTTTHQHEKLLDGNYLVELWIVEDPKHDKSIAVGLGELPKGTLCASYKIEDGNYWQKEVLSGNVKGFSLEGFFNLNNVTVMNKTKKVATKAPAKKSGLAVSFLKSVVAFMEGETEVQADDLADIAADDETDSGEPYLIFELQEGGELYVDSEGFATINDEQAPAGQHALADGNFIVIDDAGQMVVTEPEAEAVDPAAAELAAKQRGKAYLAKLGGKSPAKKPAVKGAAAARIAKLEAEIAQLKKTPSTTKARPKVETNLSNEKPSFTQNVAAVLSARLERKG